MALLKNGSLSGDPWTIIDDDHDLGAVGHPVISLDRWRAEADNLRLSNHPLGLRLRADQSPGEIGGDVDRFGVIALEFPKFSDGRPFSHARLLRERLGYGGEIRAIGHFIRDQYQFMARCGFDAFEIDDPKAVRDWHEANDELSVFYQPAVDGRTAAIHLRAANGTGA